MLYIQKHSCPYYHLKGGQ